MPEGNIAVRDTRAIAVSASPASKIRVTNGHGESLYFKNEATVSATSKDGTLAAGESKTFSSPQWFISTAVGCRMFIERIPEATTDMATQAELEAAEGGSSKALEEHVADTTAIHGIADTSLLAASAEINAIKVTYGSAAPAVSLSPGALYAQATPAELTRLFAGTIASEWNLAGVGEVEPTIVEEHAKSGKAAKFKLTGVQSRSELTLANQNAETTRIYEGQRYRYSFYAFVPTGGMIYGGAGKHNTIWQLHPAGAGATIFSLELGKYPSGEEQQGLYLEGYNNAKAFSNYFLAAFSENALHQITVEFTASEREAGSYKISLDGALVKEASAINTVNPNAETFGYVKNGIYRATEGTSELFLSQVEWVELSNGTVRLWQGQTGSVPTVLGIFQAPQFTPALTTQSGHAETFGSVSVANGATVSVTHGLKINGGKVTPKAVLLTPQNTENALEPKIYARQVNETEFEIRNSGAKTMTVYWVARI